MGKLKVFGASVGAFAGILIVIFIVGLCGLGYYKFFGPKKENIKREIFENTQSYTHGKIQELAKNFDEYNRADSPKDKESIRQVIIMRFAEFDESKIRSQALRSFLTKMRGF